MNVPEYTLSGTYLIKSANHTIDKTKEKIKISIERILNF